MLPVAGEWKLEDQADNAVIVVLDLALEALAAFEDEWFEAFFDGGALEADVFGGLVLEAGFGGAGSEELAEFVELDLFADVELDQGEDGTLERSGGGAGCQRVQLVGDGCRGGLEWAVHLLCFGASAEIGSAHV